MTSSAPKEIVLPSSTKGIIDSHAHVVREFFKEEQDEVIQRAFDSGMSHMVNPGVTINDIPELLELQQKHKKISIAVGQHPHDAKDFDATMKDRLQETLDKHDVVAVGECGLDFHYNNSDHASQLSAFREQIKLARQYNKPVIVHCRDAWEEAFQCLTEEGKGEVRGVFHCFTGGPELLPAIEKLGFYVSFSGIVTFSSAKNIQAAAPLVPIDKVLVETDCPFLAPQKVRGKRNEPAYVWFVAEKIAALRNTTLDDIAMHASNNARSLFSLPDAS
ncbi:MAG: TatD family hydrolase [Candidatus Melainabacteria bacterium]|nr:TatD family hydrolase [Candidatus Melainabacteria bacterium]